MAITELEYHTDKLSVNVQAQFLNMEPEQIKEALAHGRSELVNVCMNLTSDFNKSSVIRASNAFLCRMTYIVGKRRFDRRGTVGMHHFEVLRHAETLAEVVERLHAEGYSVFAVDNTPEFRPTDVYDFALPPKSAFVYGEEQAGLSAEEVELCDGSLYIPQRGAARSLNVAQAAAVMMAEYSRQHRV